MISQEEIPFQMAASHPLVPNAHLIHSSTGKHLFLPDGSRLFTLANNPFDAFEKAVELGDAVAVDQLIDQYGLAGQPFVDDHPPEAFPLRSLSLAVSQTCNLGCTYCYAQEGSFGGTVQSMPWEVAKAAVKRLLSEANPGERVNLAFLGGEPLINREVLHRATEFASERAAQKNIPIGFSVTTNGTLFTQADADFFDRYGFAVTISIDGIGDAHDQLRPYKSGRGSYERIIERIQSALAQQHRMQVSARVTVTPRNLRLRETLDTLIGLGFHAVGFSPMLRSPMRRDEMETDTLAVMLGQMIECGQAFEQNVVAGRRYPFSNMVMALQELHRGTHRPYPCGAGAGYLGVSAEGNLFACHRFVNDEAGAFGDLDQGVDRTQQAKWLAERHVHYQEPCQSCWARYLCGGGCHHEVIHRGRPACDYIRGWLHFCLEVYVRLREKRPDYFGLREIA